MKEENIYFHIPGFFEFYGINIRLIELMKEHPEYFYDNIKIGSVYGSFPSAIWNGGRLFFGFCSREEMKKIINKYNSFNIPLRYTFTNSLIENKQLNDTYCNMIMELSNNGLNQVLVNNDLLENYIRNNYPKYKIISSTTKRLIDKDKIAEELNKKYELVVLDYDLNHDFEYLKTITHPEKIEILVDELCKCKCPYRKEHYENFSRMQLEFRVDSDFKCTYVDRDIYDFNQVKTNDNFISNNEIYEKYKKLGLKNFKLVGRGININFVIDSYIYYLVKEEYKKLIKIELINNINKGVE